MLSLTGVNGAVRNDFKQFERQDFATDMLSDGMRYRLPRRRLGRIRQLGWIAVGFGLFMTLFMIAWMSGPISSGLEDLQKGGAAGRMGWIAIAFGCFGLLGLIPALGLLFGGIAVVRNRTWCDIEVRSGKITVKERFSLIRLRRKRATSDIQRLRVTDASEASDDKQSHDWQTWLGDYDTALMADTGGARKFAIAVAYPRELLARLAEELAPRLEADVSIASATIVRDPMAVGRDKPVLRKIEVVDGPGDSDELDESGELPGVPDQPVGSTATIQRREYGITIDIPPAGLLKGSKGLFFFALLWNAFISIFIVVATLGAVGVIEMEGDAPPWLMLVFVIPFVAVGVGMMIGAINMGRRHATIATADDLVMIVRHSIFGKSTREWSADQIAAICIGNSGMEVNDVPVRELQIHPNDGKKFGCLSQLDDDELVWIAAELNQALAIRRTSDGSPVETPAVNRDTSGAVIPAANSRVALERTIDGVRIEVPPVGLMKYVGLVIFGFVFAAIGIGIAVGVGGTVLRGGLKQGEVGQLAIAAIFLLSFGGIGSILLLIGLVAGRRQFQLTVEHDELTLLRRGPFGRKTFLWHRDDLESVDVIDSGTKVNERSLYQVFIRSRKGNSVGIMTGHDGTDLGLVATAVKESLGLPENDPDPE